MMSNNNKFGEFYSINKRITKNNFVTVMQNEKFIGPAITLKNMSRILTSHVIQLNLVML